MPGQIDCPHCGKPLRVVEEVFGSWQVQRTADDVLVMAWDEQLHTHMAAHNGMPVFDAGHCRDCGQFVNSKGGTEDE